MTTYQGTDTSTGAVRSASNGFAVAGLVCGIVGLLLANFILGPLAIIFGGVGWSRANQNGSHRGMAIAGVVLGVLDLAVFAALIAVASNHGGSVYWHVGS
jgi:hypothetical protein